MVSYKASTPRVGIVQSAFIVRAVSCILLGLLFSAAPVLGANVETFAKVNLVQGIEASLGTSSQESDALTKPGVSDRFNISGPANYCVEVQMTTLEPQFLWTDEGSAESTKFDAYHDSHGKLKVVLPVDETAGTELAVDSLRYIVTLTYE